MGNETREEMGGSHARACSRAEEVGFSFERNLEPLKGFEQNSDMTHLAYLLIQSLCHFVRTDRRDRWRSTETFWEAARVSWVGGDGDTDEVAAVDTGM